MSLEPRLLEALATVQDPELRRPITELGMVESAVLADGAAQVKVLLTIAACPMRSTIESEVSAALAGLPEVHEVRLELGVMSPEQRAELRESLKGRSIPFSDPASLTRVIGIASGKGGVGKSSLTANLACAMAADGLRVGLIDADVHGFSIPGLLGIPGAKPTRVDEMILPPVAHGVKVISIGMFVPDNKPVIWRGPMLHRALEQFLTDVHFGDLDVLLLDLPPGTGDIAISVSQLLPGSELVVVTTPQAAAAQVAERAGSIAVQTGQKVVGVIENMSWLVLPDGSTMEVFGAGGGAELAKRLELVLGTEVPLLGQVALDPLLRAGGDAGVPLVLSHPESPAAAQIVAMSRALTRRPRGLAGLKLGVTPV